MGDNSVSQRGGGGVGGAAKKCGSQRLKLKNKVARCVEPSAAKAGTDNKALIAAVNRCATQRQEQNLVFQQSVKA
jgi:hypothetical protein